MVECLRIKHPKMGKDAVKARVIEKNVFMVLKVFVADRSRAFTRLSSRLRGGLRILVPQARVRRQPICQAAFNGEFGNSRDASVHADGAKSRFPKRVARALRRRNSLRMATQLGAELVLVIVFVIAAHIL